MSSGRIESWINIVIQVKQDGFIVKRPRCLISHHRSSVPLPFPIGRQCDHLDMARSNSVQVSEGRPGGRTEHRWHLSPAGGVKGELAVGPEVVGRGFS